MVICDFRRLRNMGVRWDTWRNGPWVMVTGRAPFMPFAFGAESPP